MTMAIAGHGVDVVDVARFEAHLDGTPNLRERLFAPSERDLPVESLAARFAAKEALIKALGGPAGLSWIEIEIPRRDAAPEFRFHGQTARTISERDVTFHLSLSHDGGIAFASVIAEVV